MADKIYEHKKDELYTQVRWSLRIEELRGLCKSTGIYKD